MIARPDRIVTWIAAFLLLALGAVGLYTGYPAVHSDALEITIALGLLVSSAAVLGVHIRLLNGRNEDGQ